MRFLRFFVVAVFLLTIILFMAACCDAPSGSGCKNETRQCCPSETTAQAETDALKSLIESGKNITILDARSGPYDDGKRIPGAKALHTGASAKEASKFIKNKDDLVVTYCTNPQCPASKALAIKLRELGYSNVLEYPSGIEGWVNAGNIYESVKQ